MLYFGIHITGRILYILFFKHILVHYKIDTCLLTIVCLGWESHPQPTLKNRATSNWTNFTAQHSRLGVVAQRWPLPEVPARWKIVRFVRLSKIYHEMELLTCRMFWLTQSRNSWLAAREAYALTGVETNCTKWDVDQFRITCPTIDRCNSEQATVYLPLLSFYLALLYISNPVFKIGSYCS